MPLSAWIFNCFLFIQLKEELSVHGSDEEVDDPPEVGSDDDLSDDGDKEVDEEVWIYIFFSPAYADR